MRDLDFVKMKPMDTGLEVVSIDPAMSVRMLAQTGQSYAIYIGPKDPRKALKETPRSHNATLALELPAGTYRSEWVNTLTGEIRQGETHRHKGGRLVLASPSFSEDIALRLKRR
jgi:hypothetical protein